MSHASHHSDALAVRCSCSVGATRAPTLLLSTQTTDDSWTQTLRSCACASAHPCLRYCCSTKQRHPALTSPTGRPTAERAETLDDHAAPQASHLPLQYTVLAMRCPCPTSAATALSLFCLQTMGGLHYYMHTALIGCTQQLYYGYTAISHGASWFSGSAVGRSPHVLTPAAAAVLNARRLAGATRLPAARQA